MVIAFGGVGLLMRLAGLGFWAGYGERPGAVVGACLLQVPAPAAWTLGAVTVPLYGFIPRAAAVGWAVAGAALLTGVGLTGLRHRDLAG
ncbi:hypothetical protein [Streptomyces bauhiniae]|uniref:hypothetical protein n=1 Tax=Streptomyces bauhiniae TaxID=2340725 RepID=UPI0037D27FE7